MNNLKTNYITYIKSNCFKNFNYTNIHQIPKLQKIIINCGLGLKAQNPTFLQKAIDEIRLISGQHPMIIKSKKSIAGFKLRANLTIGLLVTLRREKMYAFLEKLIKLVFPRLRDFQGLLISNFDKNGNYNFGLSDQLVFPEIQYKNVEQKRGFNITIVIKSNNINESFFLLKEFGFPFINNTKINEK